MNLTLLEIAEATRGVIRIGNPEDVALKLCTDTRTLKYDELFVALNGKNFRGENFLSQAIDKGAMGVVTELDRVPDDFPLNKCFVQVDDTTQALGDIARAWRDVVNPTVCALTGSAGKTTTKEMLAYLCREDFDLLATQGNLNNLIGLPLTLLRLKEEHCLAVVETGMNQAGELTRLAEIARPDIGIITNVGNAHIGNFGSVEKLIAAKAELFEAMPKDSTAVINADCPHCAIMSEAFDIPSMVITYGQNSKSDVQANNLKLEKPYGYRFRLRILDWEDEILLKVFGRYQVSNALAAAAGAAIIGVDPNSIAERLERFVAPSMRANTEWLDGSLIISDCYNSSPDATITSLRSLNDLNQMNRRLAVIGDMHELGDLSEKYHRQVGEAVAEAKIDYLLTYGEMVRATEEAAESQGIATRHFENKEEIADFLHHKLEKDDVLIIKGSRTLQLEEVIRRLKELRSEARTGLCDSHEFEKGDLSNS